MRPLDPRLLKRARGARLALALDAALGLLATGALLVQATLVAYVVAAAFDGGSLRSVAAALVALALVAVLRGALAGGFEATGRRAAASVMSQLRMALVERRLRHAPLAADGAEAAEVATAAVQGVDALEAYFARYLPQLVLAVCVPLMVLVWTATVDLTSALIMLATLWVTPLFMWLIGRFVESRTRARWLALARLSNHFLDVVRGLTTLRAFSRGEAQAERIAAVSDEYRRTTMSTLRVAFLSGAVLDLAATIATALVAVTLGVRLIGGGSLELRSALIVLLLTPELYVPIRALALQFHASADGIAAAERILDLIDVPSTVGDGAGEPLGLGAGTASAARPYDVAGTSAAAAGPAKAAVPPEWSVLRLEGVSLEHPGRAGRVLEGFDLDVRRGEIVALVGESGAGKSTVASLLLGLRVPDAGKVTIDGVDLAGVDLAGWRRQVAWLPQRPTLFRGSLRENIALGDPAAGEARVEEAARLAGADVVAQELPRGYDTIIGDGGRSLSAGETRRVALARALLRDAPLLVLDEPAANLDAANVELIAAALRGLDRDRAVLLIEHSPRLGALADRVVVLEAAAQLSPTADDGGARRGERGNDAGPVAPLQGTT